MLHPTSQVLLVLTRLLKWMEQASFCLYQIYTLDFFSEKTLNSPHAQYKKIVNRSSLIKSSSGLPLA